MIIIYVDIIKQNYAKTLVNADRTAMFLVDRHTNEIYSHVFDVGNEAYGPSGASKNEIRFENTQTKLPFVYSNFIFAFKKTIQNVFKQINIDRYV